MRLIKPADMNSALVQPVQKRYAGRFLGTMPFGSKNKVSIVDLKDNKFSYSNCNT